MPQNLSFPSKILREPLVHFAVLGLLLFGVFFALNESEPEADYNTITVTETDVARSAATFETTWNRPPTETETAGLVQEMVREEVYVRQALALGLDVNDSVIRRRLRQKMEFLTEASAEAANPSDEVLIAYYKENPDRYSSPVRLAFDQIFLGEAPATGAAEETLNALQSGSAPETLGQRSMLPPVMGMSTQRNVEGTFGRGVFEQIEAGPTEGWFGPVLSTFGQHIVRKIGFAPTEVLPFESVRDDVQFNWKTEFTDQLKAERYELLREQFRVVLPDEFSEKPEGSSE